VAPYWEQPDAILSIQRLKSIGSLVRQNPGTKGVSLFQEGCERPNCDANCASSSVGGFLAAWKPSTSQLGFGIQIPRTFQSCSRRKSCSAFTAEMMSAARLLLNVHLERSR
jgi:hypothetical protein